MVLLVLVVVRVVVGVAHCLAAAAACAGGLGAEVGRMKRQEGEEYDKPLLLHVLVLLLAKAPQSRPLVDGGRRPIIIVVNVCKPEVRPPPAAAAAAAITRVAHCKSSQ